MSETLTHLTSFNTTKTKSNRRWDVYRGHSPDIISQLVEKSKEDDIPLGDRHRRFKNLVTFNEWEQERTTYAALNADTGELDAWVWFGTKPFPEMKYREKADPERGSLERVKHAASMTDDYAIRTYQSARGAGAARPLTLIGLKDYTQSRTSVEDERPLMTGVWLETNLSNTPAIGLYTHLGGLGLGGFDVVARISEEDRVSMMLPLDRILALTEPIEY